LVNKEARTEHIEEAITYSKNYDYSSYKDHLGEVRQQSSILEIGSPDIPGDPISG
jgi:hypothetical protein